MLVVQFFYMLRSAILALDMGGDRSCCSAQDIEVYVGIAEWSMLIDIKKQEVQVLLSSSFISI
jgi:hypothetical protein